MTRKTLSTLLLFAALSSCAGPDVASLIGDYRRSHKVYVFHGNEPVEVGAEDRLLLLEEADDKIRFSLRVAAVNGETCEMEGVATARRDAFEFHSATVEGCVLRIQKQGAEILVEDVADACQPEFCAQRASIGRLAFPMANPGDAS